MREIGSRCVVALEHVRSPDLRICTYGGCVGYTLGAGRGGGAHVLRGEPCREPSGMAVHPVTLRRPLKPEDEDRTQEKADAMSRRACGSRGLSRSCPEYGGGAAETTIRSMRLVRGRQLRQERCRRSGLRWCCCSTRKTIALTGFRPAQPARTPGRRSCRRRSSRTGSGGSPA